MNMFLFSLFFPFWRPCCGVCVSSGDGVWDVMTNQDRLGHRGAQRVSPTAWEPPPPPPKTCPNGQDPFWLSQGNEVKAQKAQHVSVPVNALAICYKGTTQVPSSRVSGPDFCTCPNQIEGIFQRVNLLLPDHSGQMHPPLATVRLRLLLHS